jgi:glycosyltransferase involved in cell wall biosynthesis
VSIPLVTIVVPVWDEHAKLIARCLAAIERERVPTHTVIVDNASTEAIEIPPAARGVTLPSRLSIGAARNAGLQHVTTPYVVFADADDEIAPGSLRRSLALIDRSPSAVGVIGRSIVDENGHPRRGRTPTRAYQSSSRWLPPLTPLLWLTGFQASITSTLLRTDYVRDAGGFDDGDLGEDWALAARLSRRGPFICIDSPVRIYHRHADATRVTHYDDSSSGGTRRRVCRDCIADARSTSAQRLLATALSCLDRDRRATDS